MKFDVDDKNRCLVCVKFHLNRCRFAVAVAKCLGGSLFWDTVYIVQLMPLHPKTPSSLASFKSRLVLTFWYQVTQVVLEKRPLNGCSSS